MNFRAADVRPHKSPSRRHIKTVEEYPDYSAARRRVHRGRVSRGAGRPRSAAVPVARASTRCAASPTKVVSTSQAEGLRLGDGRASVAVRAARGAPARDPTASVFSRPRGYGIVGRVGRVLRVRPPDRRVRTRRRRELVRAYSRLNGSRAPATEAGPVCLLYMRNSSSCSSSSAPVWCPSRNRRFRSTVADPRAGAHPLRAEVPG